MKAIRILPRVVFIWNREFGFLGLLLFDPSFFDNEYSSNRGGADRLVIKLDY